MDAGVEEDVETWGATFGKFHNAASLVALCATSLAYGFSTISRGQDLQTTTSNYSVQITVKELEQIFGLL